MIEDILLNHPKVDEVGVIGVPDPRLFQEVCACVVPKSKTQLTVKELEEFVTSRMIDESFSPKYYIFLDSLPRGKTGKTDRFNLMRKAIEDLSIY